MDPRLGARGGIPTISLFSGAGGLDLGFLQAGFDIRACVEIESAYAKTLKANLGREAGFGVDTVVHCEDIRKFDARPYKNMGIRCVIGGPPCQTFSAAGRRAGGVIGTQDERGQLFQAYCRILDELQPEVFVFENVYGLPGANGGGPWQQILRAFSERGYKLEATVVDAADYGVPQHRERLIMVGSREGQFQFPLPTHGPDSRTGMPLVGVEEAIQDLQQPDEPYHDNLGGLYGHLLPLVPEGLNYAFFTAEMGHPAPVFAWRSKFHDLLYKVDRGAPCRTIKAQPGKFTGPFHWKNRHFTVSELKRLQSFPDGYEIGGTFGKVIEQIGNSVPPRLAYVIAQSVRDQLLDHANQLTFEVRPNDFNSTFRQRQRLRSAHFARIAKDAIRRQRKAKASPTTTNLLVERYCLSPKGLFDRQRMLDRPSDGSKFYEVTISMDEEHVQIAFRTSTAGTPASVVMGGLKKYLQSIDTLTLTGTAAHPEDVFHAWAVIENALVQRSRFFSLIDIYGHYANRGDTVTVDAEWTLPDHPALQKLVNKFSQSEACGGFVSEDVLKKALHTSEAGLQSVVEEARAIRFDIRTMKTHPIVGKGRLLCTYPFPLLSPRAMVESKAKILELVTDDEGADLRVAS